MWRSIPPERRRKLLQSFPSPTGLVPASGDPESLGQETKEVCPDSCTKGVLSVGPIEAKDSQEQVGSREAAGGSAPSL